MCLQKMEKIYLRAFFVGQSRRMFDEPVQKGTQSHAVSTTSRNRRKIHPMLNVWSNVCVLMSAGSRLEVV